MGQICDLCKQAGGAFYLIRISIQIGNRPEFVSPVEICHECLYGRNTWLQITADKDDSPAFWKNALCPIQLSEGETTAAPPAGDDRECQCFNECVCGKREKTLRQVYEEAAKIPAEEIVKMLRQGDAARKIHLLPPGMTFEPPYAIEVALEILRTMKENRPEDSQLKKTAAITLETWLRSSLSEKERAAAGL